MISVSGEVLKEKQVLMTSDVGSHHVQWTHTAVDTYSSRYSNGAIERAAVSSRAIAVRICCTMFFFQEVHKKRFLYMFHDRQLKPRPNKFYRVILFSMPPHSEKGFDVFLSLMVKFI